GTLLGFTKRIQVSNGLAVDPSARYHVRAGVRAPSAGWPSWPKCIERSTYTGRSVVTIVANSSLCMTTLASSVARELGDRSRSNGVCRPVGVTNRKWATVDCWLGLCSAKLTSNGACVLPSAKYQRRD